MVSNKYSELGQHCQYALIQAQQAADNTPVVWESSRYEIFLHGWSRMKEEKMKEAKIPTNGVLSGGIHSLGFYVKGNGGKKQDAGTLAAYKYLKDAGYNVELKVS